MSRTKEEAIAAGITIAETRHNMKRRKPWHDYHGKGTYMLTLVVNGRMPVLGKLAIHTQQQGAHVELTELGKAIFHEEVLKIPVFYKMVEVWRLCIMPDHIHMIVRVKEDMPDGKSLGDVVRGFKVGCTRAWWRLSQMPAGETAGVVANDRATGVAANDGTAGVVANDRTAGVVANDRAAGVAANDRTDGVAAVIVHSAYSDQEYEDCKRLWLACGERGGVLVSASIATREKEVMREAMNRGYRIIAVRENGFPPLYKPAGESFDACSEGRLLQVSPWQYHMQHRTISREQCLMLNRLVETITTLAKK